ncbi:hypothetical protein BRETT_001725 [Brettanomyces bruxellensis]|uniref:Uncharacterized protein n=1 Tax=Dekkera bruxellensis TaxID=5007 RepID=A0A871R4M8_DEKBR|nr:uncharacterized protein BRETT_001725 [Brettanomyces bruxellensis]QOU18658.1 hypothetical protein BRETT_001725 [Brettanomyces bruxellensis]
MSITYNLEQKQELGNLSDGVTCNILPVHIDYTGYVSSGSNDWNRTVEQTQMTDKLNKGWNGISEEDQNKPGEDAGVLNKKDEHANCDTDISNPKDRVNVAYLRGRRLLGREYNIKEKYNYEISVFQEKDDGIGGISDEKIYDRIGRGDKLVSYGHDSLPDIESDSAKKLEEWLELSNAIHGNQE